jgi:tetratricopeptide (TPR) repeat protein
MRSRGKTQSERSPPRARNLWPVAFPPLLVAAIVIVYFPSLRGEFLFDDEVSIQTNESIRALWPPGRPLRPPAYAPVAGRPLLNFSFAVNYAMGGLDPRGYRLVNLALHALCALLLWSILRSTLRRPGWRSRLDAVAEPVAAATALLWALHPLLVDAVAYVTQRSELLVSLFYLLTLACAIRGWSAPQGSRHQTVWFGLAAIACAAGMLCKEIMVSAPLAVLLFDRAFYAGSFKTALIRGRRLYIPLAATWVLLFLLVIQGSRSESAGLGLGVSPWQYLLTQAKVLAEYLRLFVWPAPLTIARRVPLAHSIGEVAVPGTLIAALLAATLWTLVRHPRLAVPLACFFMILAPTSSVIPIASEIYAERRMYLPAAALLALLVPAIWFALDKRRVPAVTMVILVMAVSATLAVLTFTHARRYGDAMAIWDHAIRIDPNNETAHLNRGATLANRNRRDDAIASFDRALAANPRSVLAYYNLGIQHMALRRLDLASDHFARALQLQPRAWMAAQQLANSLALQNRMVEAADAYEKALRLKPDWVQGLNDLAWIRATSPIDALRNGRQALELATRACERSGWQDPAHLDTLAAALAETGQFAPALTRIDQAIALARAGGQRDLLAQMLERRAEYQANHAHRDRPVAP